MTNNLLNKLNSLESNPDVFITHEYGVYFVFDIKLLNQQVVFDEPFYYCKEAFNEHGEQLKKAK